jgi:hypothetical protein
MEIFHRFISKKTGTNFNAQKRASSARICRTFHHDLTIKNHVETRKSQQKQALFKPAAALKFRAQSHQEPHLKIEWTQAQHTAAPPPASR